MTNPIDPKTLVYRPIPDPDRVELCVDAFNQRIYAQAQRTAPGDPIILGLIRWEFSSAESLAALQRFRDAGWDATGIGDGWSFQPPT